VATKREITPAELQTVFSLAATMPDLTVLPAELAELADLRRRVVRGEAAVIAVKQSQVVLEHTLRRLAVVKGVTL
jgi:hypothetical protein